MWLGRVRDECKNVPPVRPALSTMSSVRTIKQALLSAFLSRISSVIPAHPRRSPITLYPSLFARIVTARMAGFKPGTSPPPVRIPMTPLLFLLTFAMTLYIEFILSFIVNAIKPDKSIKNH
jgi:hypothetical protein